MFAVVFDMDDTLFDLGAIFGEVVKHSVPEFPESDVRGLYRSFRKYGDLYFEASQSGAMSLDVMRVRRVQDAFGDYGIHLSEQEAREFQNRYVKQQKTLEVHPIVQEILHDLKRQKIALGLITNGKIAHQSAKLDAIHIEQWIPEEQCLISEAVGFDKPAPEIFKAMETIMGTDTLLMVGDALEKDIEGSLACGWDALWLQHEKSEHPQSTTYATLQHDIQAWINKQKGSLS